MRLGIILPTSDDSFDVYFSAVAALKHISHTRLCIFTETAFVITIDRARDSHVKNYKSSFPLGVVATRRKILEISNLTFKSLKLTLLVKSSR